MADPLQQPTALTCFISAASTTDTSALTVALQAAGVAVRTSAEIPLGQDISAALSNAILATDLVCVAVDNDPPSPTVAFETGVAAGSRRPILVVIDGSPDHIERGPLASMPRIVFDSSDTESVRTLYRTIHAYVRNIQPLAARLQIDWNDWIGPEAAARGVLNSTIRASGLERHIAERLARAGAVVTTEDREFDAIATFPSLGGINRVAVEVKSRRSPTGKRLQTRDREQLRSKMIENGISLGILVYGGNDTATEIDFDSESLFGEVFGGILIVSAAELLRWRDPELIQELTRLRNTVIHSQR